MIQHATKSALRPFAHHPRGHRGRPVVRRRRVKRLVRRRRVDLEQRRAERQRRIGRRRHVHRRRIVPERRTVRRRRLRRGRVLRGRARLRRRCAARPAQVCSFQKCVDARAPCVTTRATARRTSTASTRSARRPTAARPDGGRVHACGGRDEDRQVPAAGRRLRARTPEPTPGEPLTCLECEYRPPARRRSRPS